MTIHRKVSRFAPSPLTAISARRNLLSLTFRSSVSPDGLARAACRR
ncbi:MAG: hypothetical protein AB8I69_15220 [Anaerolineae bacterium]